MSRKTLMMYDIAYFLLFLFRIYFWTVVIIVATCGAIYFAATVGYVLRDVRHDIRRWLDERKCERAQTDDECPLQYCYKHGKPIPKPGWMGATPTAVWATALAGFQVRRRPDVRPTSQKEGNDV